MLLLAPEEAERLFFELETLLLQAEEAPTDATPNTWLDRLVELRRMSERFFKTALKNERISVTKLYEMEQLVIDRFGLSSQVAEQMAGMRKLCNMAAHYDQERPNKRISALGLKMAIKAFTGMVAAMSPEAIVPSFLVELISNKEVPYFKGSSPTAQVLLLPEDDDLPQLAYQLGPLDIWLDVLYKDGSTMVDRDGVTLQGIDLSTEAMVTIRLNNTTEWVGNDQRGLSFQYLNQKLWPNALLRFHRLKPSTSANTYENDGTSTLVVLEPDFLMDASTLAELIDEKAFRPFDFLLKHLFPSGSSPSTVKGNMVNALLDAAIVHEDWQPDQVKLEILKQNGLFLGQLADQEVDSLWQDALDNHLPTILNQVAQMRKGSTTGELRLVLEPSFYSAAYGLSGRLDIMTTHVATGQHSVIELKAGKVPNEHQGLWISNKLQTTAYKLLLQSTYNQDCQASVFYSQAKDRPERVATIRAYEQRLLLDGRNHVVSILFHCTDFENSMLRWVYTASEQDIEAQIGRFNTQAAKRLQQCLRDSDKESLTYFSRYLNFAIRDAWLAKTGRFGAYEREDAGFARLWNLTLGEKRKHFSILYPLQLQHFDTEANTLTLVLQKPEDGQMLPHAFRENDLCLIYPAPSVHTLDPLKNQILKGTIVQLTGDKLVLSLRNRQLDGYLFEQFDTWALESDLFESQLWTQVGQLGAFMSLPPVQRALWLGQRAPALQVPLPEEVAQDIASLDRLNDNQRHLVAQALASPEYYLIEGPPGTGKTSTVLMTMLAMLRKHFPEERIVIVAYTNRAVQEIGQRMASQGLQFWSVNSAKHIAGGDSLSSFIEAENGKGIKQFVAGQRLILGTVSTMMTRIEDISRYGQIDRLIIDEASQLTEPVVLTLLAKAKRVIMIGDKNQLPPVVAQGSVYRQLKEEDYSLRALGITELGGSIYERLWLRCEQQGWAHALGMLQVQYRMHQDIQQLINHHYGGRLIPGTETQTTDWKPWYDASLPALSALPQARVIFWPSERVATDREHLPEAKRIVAMCQAMTQNATWQGWDNETRAEAIGIITPWRAQAALITRLMPLALLPYITVDTVERYQGAERKVVLISMAVHHPSQISMAQSLSQGDPRLDRKLLVALSRAQQQVIVLGYEPALQVAPAYQDLLMKVSRVV